MAKLKDYISGMVASVTTARYNADVQSAEIARRYKEDSVLANFSVPRMRVGDVEIEFPYALNQQVSQSVGLVLDEDRTYRAMLAALCKSYGVSELPTTDTKTTTALCENMEDVAREIVRGVRKNGQAYLEENGQDTLKKNISEWMDAMDSLGLKLSSDKDEVLASMYNAVLLSLQSDDLKNLEVIAEADKLSAYDSRVITRMKIKIQEDGLVWANTANGEILVTE